MAEIKEFLKANFWIPLLFIAVAVALWQLVDPAPPRGLTIATGSPEGRYYQLAKLLQEDLNEQGVTLDIVSTAGSGENMQLLLDADSEVSIAFVQSGMERMFEGSEQKLAGLGGLYYEPLWMFYRKDISVRLLTDLKGYRVAIGAAGSGTQLVARYLAADNGLDDPDSGVTLVEADAEESVQLLRNGDVEAAIFTVSAQSQVIQELIEVPAIDFMDVTRADAYVARYPFLTDVTIYEGLLDMERNIPAADRRTLSSVATLVVNERFHPSLTPLILESMSKRVKSGGVLERPQSFPSAEHSGFDLAKEAEHYYEYGPPFLMRFMPFWAASLVDRLVIFIIPLMVILIPLSKLAGPVYRWRIRSRIYRWYRYLLEIDRDITEGKVDDPQAELQKIDRLTGELAEVEVPLSYADELYHLKQHVEYVRRRLQALEQAQPVSPRP